MRQKLNLLAILVWAFAINSCQQYMETEKLSLIATEFADIADWNKVNKDGALQAFRKSCDYWQKFPNKYPAAVGGVAISRRQWQDVCAEAFDAVDSNIFFTEFFKPYKAVSTITGEEGLLTGYYEPVVKGSYHADSRYKYPVWGVPKDLIAGIPYMTRQQIEEKGLLSVAEPLLWVDDYIDLFFLHIQGSGIVQFPDGKKSKLLFAAKNGHPYQSIGAILIKRGEIAREDMSMFAIKEWLRNNEEDMQQLMWQNSSYIFFKLTDAGNIVGAQSVELTPWASLAVDTDYMEYGVPILLETSLPGNGAECEGCNIGAYKNLAIAQDTGSAIKGALRGDLFLGSGLQAEWLAGNMQQKAKFIVLLPSEL